VPRTGAVLVTPNHVSFVDALFLVTAIRRPVRFVIEASWYERWWLRARRMLRAMRDAGEGLDRGEVVCIFPEGQLTRTGTLLPFRRGMTRLVKGRRAVVLPVYMDRVWGSVFSRERGRFLLKWPKRLPYRVTLAIGRPLPAETPVADVRRAVQELSVDAWEARRADRPPLHHTRRARRCAAGARRSRSPTPRARRSPRGRPSPGRSRWRARSGRAGPGRSASASSCRRASAASSSTWPRASRAASP
jgi:1-acyl-sn-glycerol-3-phosphate acyltransferase